MELRSEDVEAPLRSIRGQEMSVDASGSWAALTSRRQLMVVSLDNPWRGASRTLHQESPWDVGSVQFHPHTAAGPVVGAIVHDSVMLWDVGHEQRTPMQSSLLKAHARPVQDFCWSPHVRYQLATGSRDRLVKSWDIRQPKTAALTVDVGGAVGSVEWSRHQAHMVAVAVEGQVKLLDLRQTGRAVVESFAAHLNGVVSMDWSYTQEHGLVTHGHEAVLKYWNVRAPAQPIAVQSFSQPVSKVLCTPFADGVVSGYTSGEIMFKLWKLPPLTLPPGASSSSAPSTSAPPPQSNGLELALALRQTPANLSAAAWRVVERSWEKQYQLVSWSKAGLLRLWTLTAADRASLDSGSSLTSSMSSHTVGLHDGSTSELHTVGGGSDLKGGEDEYLSYTFAQEMAWLRARPQPALAVEILDPAARYCVLAVVGPQAAVRVRLKVSFPSVYPRGAPPSFDLINPSALAVEDKVRLKEKLSTVADRYVSLNQPCLRACLATLLDDSAVLALLPSDATPSEGPPTSTSTLPAAHQEEDWMHYTMDTDEWMASTSKSNPPKSAPPTSDDGRWKSLRESSITVPSSSLSPSLSSSEHLSLANSGQTPYAFLNGSGEEEREDVLPCPRTHGAVFSRDGRLVVFAVRQARLPVPRTYARWLAQSSRAQADEEDEEGDSLWAASAAAGGEAEESARVRFFDATPLLPVRPSLARAYVIERDSLGELCAANARVCRSMRLPELQRMWEIFGEMVRDELYVRKAARPWAAQPFGRALLARFVRHYVRLGDVQTLGMIGVVVGLQRARDQGGGGLALEYDRALFDHVRVRYAELLQRWGLRNHAVFVRKLCHHSEEDYSSIEYGQVAWFSASCDTCGAPISRSKRFLPNEVCATCRRFSVRCTLCHLPVKGQGAFCLLCSHGGHTAHLHDWFLHSSKCPSGCGCNCILQKPPIPLAPGLK